MLECNYAPIFKVNSGILNKHNAMEWKIDNISMICTNKINKRRKEQAKAQEQYKED